MKCVYCQNVWFITVITVLISSVFILFQAALSLQTAAQRRLGEDSASQHVQLGSAVEIDKHCQRVLQKTYGHCVFPDILEIDYTRHSHGFCVTHGGMCPFQPSNDAADCTLSEQNTTEPNYDL